MPIEEYFLIGGGEHVFVSEVICVIFFNLINFGGGIFVNFLAIYLLFFSLYSPGWPWIHHLPASAFPVFGLCILALCLIFISLPRHQGTAKLEQSGAPALPLWVPEFESQSPPKSPKTNKIKNKICQKTPNKQTNNPRYGNVVLWLPCKGGRDRWVPGTRRQGSIVQCQANERPYLKGENSEESHLYWLLSIAVWSTHAKAAYIRTGLFGTYGSRE